MATQTELDEMIAGVELPLLPEARKKSFNCFSEMKSYFQTEVSFWQTTSLSQISAAFQEVSTTLLQAEQRDLANARREVGLILAKARGDTTRLIYSTTALGQFLKALSLKDQTAARAALPILRGSVESDALRSESGLYGVMKALFYNHPDLSSAATSAEVLAFQSQRTAIDKTRHDFEVDFNSLKTEAEEWKNSDQLKAADLCKKHGEEFENLKQRFDGEHKEQTDSIAKWQVETEKKVTDLEKVYREKLRLEKPAEYWNELESKYTRQGRWGVCATLLFAAAIAALAGIVVYRPPEILNSNQFTLGGFKGALILAAAGSALLYAINLLIKLTTSSFHLARDARERYQLTHVYLALKNEGSMDDKEREIVLSALFSRSDTGLLKGDSGPSFPPTPLGAIIEQLAKTK